MIRVKVMGEVVLDFRRIAICDMALPGFLNDPLFVKKNPLSMDLRIGLGALGEEGFAAAECRRLCESSY